MLAITKTLISKGILNFDVQFDEMYNGKAFVFLNKEEELNKNFFNRLWEVEEEYGAQTEISYSKKHDCILITFF